MNPNAKADLLRRLHTGPEMLVLPNAWDVASARMTEAEGFPAVATSSAGCAAVFGYPDGQRIPRSEMIWLLKKIVQAVDVPVTADVEAGYDDPVQTALEVANTGAAGLNLEELDPSAIAQVRAATSLVINARTDIWLGEQGDPATRFDRAVDRLNAYREAGADCLFAPGVTDREAIARLVDAVKGPLNILATAGAPSLAELRQLGVARVSFGSGPSRVALGAARRFARTLRGQGTFDALATEAIPYAEIQEILSRP